MIRNQLRDTSRVDAESFLPVLRNARQAVFEDPNFQRFSQDSQRKMLKGVTLFGGLPTTTAENVVKIRV